MIIKFHLPTPIEVRAAHDEVRGIFELEPLFSKGVKLRQLALVSVEGKKGARRYFQMTIDGNGIPRLAEYADNETTAFDRKTAGAKDEVAQDDPVEETSDAAA